MNQKKYECLTTGELCERWKTKPQTLAHWRSINKGPKWFKLGGLVRYKLEDVEEYENESMSNAQQAVAD